MLICVAALAERSVVEHARCRDRRDYAENDEHGDELDEREAAITKKAPAGALLDCKLVFTDRGWCRPGC